MRIMLDSNVLVSYIVFDSSFTSNVVIIHNHTILLTEYILHETEIVISKKFPHRFVLIQEKISKLEYLLFNKCNFKKETKPYIRDLKDLPILLDAINSQSDILLTGDKDFSQITLQDVRILTPRQYNDEFVV